MKYKSISSLIVIFVAIAQFAHSDSHVLPDLDCKQRIYERLIAQNRVTEALATRFSDSTPMECKILIRERTRKAAIEQTDYFTSKNADQSYRVIVLESEEKDNFINYDFQVIGAILTADPDAINRPKIVIDQVRGYTSVSGKQ